MSCPFYNSSKYGYYCEQKKDDVGWSTYNIYCSSSYNYENCGLYSSKESGGCYLTTACVVSKNLSDDCDELQTLRMFRDTYLHAQAFGKSDISYYYNVAPQITQKISSLSNSKEIYQKIYDEVITPCIRFIKDEKNREAYLLYKSKMLELETLYLS